MEVWPTVIHCRLLDYQISYFQLEFLLGHEDLGTIELFRIIELHTFIWKKTFRPKKSSGSSNHFESSITILPFENCFESDKLA